MDAGMLACTLSEIRGTVLGARVEKVFQPERDEIVLQLRSFEGGRRLLINAGSNTPRLCLTDTQKENPATPPMLCMLLRKHLQGAKLADARQEGFERVATLEFDTRDEMGFDCKKYLIVEIMGKYSNLIFADENRKILSVLHPVDFSTSSQRQVLPGMLYELPPSQNKRDPLTVTSEELDGMLTDAPTDALAERWIMNTFLGISAAVAREIAHRAHALGKTIGETNTKELSESFFAITGQIKGETFTPCMVLDGEKPTEYAFCALTHYGNATVKSFERPSVLLDTFFETRDRELHVRQRASDILKILSAADVRIRKKLELQRGELADCEKGAEYKKYADLITANMHLLSRGMRSARLIDYEDYREDGSFGECNVELDHRLPPAANAQRYYKRYNKSKTAKVELARQIDLGERELEYLDTVLDSLTRAETAADLAQIREELYRSGYASKMKQYVSPKKQSMELAEFCTTGGYRVLCGKNNLQNEYITHKLAAKTDYWFHIKSLPGSHTVMLCGGEEPSERDFTEAAEIAAYHSKGSDGQNIEVDYTQVKNVKKPAGTKPGFVIYHTNWSCVVTPSAEKVKALRVK